MAKSEQTSGPGTPSGSDTELAAYLEMPDERRAQAKAAAAVLIAVAQRVANELPFGADVDDFRRVLVSEAE